MISCYELIEKYISKIILANDVIHQFEILRPGDPDKMVIGALFDRKNSLLKRLSIKYLDHRSSLCVE